MQELQLKEKVKERYSKIALTGNCATEEKAAENASSPMQHATASGTTTIPPNWWLKIDQYIALAAIDAIKHPVQSNDPNRNKPIDQNTLNTLEDRWINQSFEQIDNAFINNVFENV
jgi:hypothetical protein